MMCGSLSFWIRKGKKNLIFRRIIWNIIIFGILKFILHIADDEYSIKIIDKQTNQQIKLIGPDELRSGEYGEFWKN